MEEWKRHNGVKPLKPGDMANKDNKKAKPHRGLEPSKARDIKF